MSKRKDRVIHLNAPSSKSISHRALMVAGLAVGESLITNLLASEDIAWTRACLEKLGVGFEDTEDGLKVKGLGGKIASAASAQASTEPLVLNVGESGTTCRLLTAIVAAGQGSFQIQGQGRMHERPIDALELALKEQGVTFFYLQNAGCPPFILHTGGFRGGKIEISMEQSSQFLSGLLLGASMAKERTVITVSGRKIVSWPYVGLTIKVMQEFGLGPEIEILENGTWQTKPLDEIDEIVPGRIRFIVTPGRFLARTFNVEGDYSNASYLLAAGALKDEPVVVHNLNPDSLQGDKEILNILSKMGARVTWQDEAGGDPARVLVEKQRLHGVQLDMGSCPDLVPTVAVLMALADGPSRITNVAHLRIKESDRLQAVSNELARVGCKTRLLEDGIEIFPQKIPQGQSFFFKTYNDHRLAMSLSLFQLAGIDVNLDNPACVAKSFPGFWQEWAKVVNE
ncbi:3-phosphoshikimate 1-carboxyvinyltransferase [Desulfohalobiaceae bacterium Ax17]|uniref:3-phosphoshikimate 1-carboxyvinyltransferase n=1 Tax=Desulfovulcanus ferrireducens TaxID=2831190 RepID=UPI00207BCF57|nr:3-phosphoshikimate 1-carboxyvinyltransferase [Desulfovulcanus ferrireducens]MBT8762616.1 3-phosphoshikimate 1-carboxyvinyltransferase [Desulfovulcanus ferrireducens]